MQGFKFSLTKPRICQPTNVLLRPNILINVLFYFFRRDYVKDYSVRQLKLKCFYYFLSARVSNIWYNVKYERHFLFLLDLHVKYSHEWYLFTSLYQCMIELFASMTTANNWDQLCRHFFSSLLSLFS